MRLPRGLDIGGDPVQSICIQVPDGFSHPHQRASAVLGPGLLVENGCNDCRNRNHGPHEADQTRNLRGDRARKLLAFRATLPVPAQCCRQPMPKLSAMHDIHSLSTVRQSSCMLVRVKITSDRAAARHVLLKAGHMLQKARAVTSCFIFYIFSDYQAQESVLPCSIILHKH